MAAKYTTVLAALVAVLISSTRRKPDYIRRQALVSLLYPYFYQEKIAGSATFGGGAMVELLKNYAVPADQVNGFAVFAGGDLTDKSYTAPAEQINGFAVFGGGDLTDKSYIIPTEQINGSATFGGIDSPSVPYTNWPTEQINGSATFGGGAMG